MDSTTQEHRQLPQETEYNQGEGRKISKVEVSEKENARSASLVPFHIKIPENPLSNLMGAETYFGIVESVEDAILLVEACRRGLLPRVSRRLGDRDRALIRSGSIFVFVERESGIKRWTDGKIWSPSRITGEFLSYRQLEQRVAPVKRPLGEQIRVLGGRDDNFSGGLELIERGGTVLKKDGLVKKTISLRVSDETCHLISYLLESGIDSSLKRTLPSKNTFFASLKDSQIFSSVVPVRTSLVGINNNVSQNVPCRPPLPILPNRPTSSMSSAPSQSSFYPPIVGAIPQDLKKHKVLLTRSTSRRNPKPDISRHDCSRIYFPISSQVVHRRQPFAQSSKVVTTPYKQISLPNPVVDYQNLMLPPLRPLSPKIDTKMNIVSLVSAVDTCDVNDTIDDDSLLLHHFVEAINNGYCEAEKMR